MVDIQMVYEGMGGQFMHHICWKPTTFIHNSDRYYPGC